MGKNDTSEMDEGRRLHWERLHMESSNKRLDDAVKDAPPDDLWSNSVKQRLAAPASRVAVHSSWCYRVSADVGRRSSHEQMIRLQELLDMLKELNDYFEGELVKDLHILLNCDPVVLGLQTDLMEWFREYAEQRIGAVYPEQESCPVTAQDVVFRELWPFHNDLCCMPDSVHGIVMEQVRDYFIWELASRTWLGEMVSFKRQENGSIDILTRFTDEPRREHVSRIVQMQKWAFSDIPIKLTVELERAEDAPDLKLSQPQEQVLEHLRSRAEDIMEMRPLLVRNFKAKKTLTRLADGVWVAFDWATGHRLVQVYNGPSEEQLLWQWSSSTYQGILSLRPDGLLAYEATPWLTGVFYDAHLPTSVLGANLVVVDAIHELLFSFWEQIDIDAVLRRLQKAVAEGPLEEEEATEFVSATIQKVEGGEAARPLSGRVIRSLRFNTLVRVLKSLGCEISPGKGSEVKVFREGGKIYSLPHHKRNDHYPPFIIKKLLRRLDISLAQWAGALGI